KKKEEVLTSIKFTCEYCDHSLDVPVEEAGKRVPCPECRRIVKVPNPMAKVEKKDWLKSSQPTEPAPAGAWGTGGKATAVSEEALEEAGAIEEEPRTLRQKLVWRGGLAVVLALLFWGGMSIWSWWGG